MTRVCSHIVNRFFRFSPTCRQKNTQAPDLIVRLAVFFGPSARVGCQAPGLVDITTKKPDIRQSRRLGGFFDFWQAEGMGQYCSVRSLLPSGVDIMSGSALYETFARAPLAFDRGEGSWLITGDG